MQDITESRDAAAGLQEGDVAPKATLDKEAAQLQQAFEEHARAAEAQQEAAYPGGWGNAGGVADGSMQVRF